MRKAARYTFSLILLLGFISNGCEAQGFGQYLDRLLQLPAGQRQAVADSFMNSGSPIPYPDNDTVVYFVYNGQAQTVTLAGDATGWAPALNLINVPATTFWYRSAVYDDSARLDYKFVINQNNWILDPGNPHTCAGGFGPNSELRMPQYQVPPEISYYNQIPHGTLKDTLCTSQLLGNTRKVQIYLPPGYPATMESYPVMLFHDGPDYLGLGSTRNILDYLIAQHEIVPVIAIFVPAVDRDAEYAGSKKDLYTGFIVSELMPSLDGRLRTSRDPAKRATAGASNGGNIALYIGMKYPGSFGKIAAQSSNVINTIPETLSSGPLLNLEFYLDIGKYDIDVLIPKVNSLREILQARGYPHQYHQWPEGHSWGNWKGHLRLPLIQFFPYASGLYDPPSDQPFKLLQNRPNPFFGSTIVPFIARPGSRVELSILDMQGRKLASLFSGDVSASKNQVDYHHALPSGNYLLVMDNEEMMRQTIKITALP